MNLSYMNAGDPVVVRFPVGTAEWSSRETVIERVTQTQIIIAGPGGGSRKFWRASGAVVSGFSAHKRGTIATLARRAYIEPVEVPSSGAEFDEQQMRKMREDVQAAAAVFEVAPSPVNFDTLSELVKRWRDIAAL